MHRTALAKLLAAPARWNAQAQTPIEQAKRLLTKEKAAEAEKFRALYALKCD